MLIAAPLIAWQWHARGFAEQPVAALPIPKGAKKPKTFSLLRARGYAGFLSTLPRLFNVIQGSLHFTGVAPLTVPQAQKLPPDWKRLYYKGQAGIIPLHAVDGNHSTPEGRYASDAYYAAHQGPVLDTKILIRALVQRIRL